MGCLIDSFPYVCVHLISLYTCFPCFLCLCVCGCGWRSVVYCRAVSREFLNCVGLNSSFLLQSAASFLQAPLKIFYTQMRILKLPSKKKKKCSEIEGSSFFVSYRVRVQCISDISLLHTYHMSKDKSIDKCAP